MLLVLLCRPNDSSGRHKRGRGHPINDRKQGDYLEQQDSSAAVKAKAEPDAPKAATGQARADRETVPPPQKEQPVKRSLFDLIDAEKNPQAAKLKDEIESVKKDRHALIDQIKAVKRRLSYKLAESETIEKFLQSEPEKDFDEKMRKVRQLRRQKERLEFRISTEASSLTDEKALIRRIKEISAELDIYMRTVRLVRKRDLVKKDIEEYSAKAGELDKQIADLDKKLDSLYDGLRKLLNVERERTAPERQARKRAEKKQPAQEVNLEDIAVIKKRK